MCDQSQAPTLSGIYTQLEHLLVFIDAARKGPVTWKDGQGNSRISSHDENLSYIEDQILCLAGDVENLSERILHLTGEKQNETN